MAYDGALRLSARAKELADYPVLTKSGITSGIASLLCFFGERRGSGLRARTSGAKRRRADDRPVPETSEEARGTSNAGFIRPSSWFREQGERWDSARFLGHL